MEYWLGFDVAPLVKSKLMYATLNWEELIRPDVPVHLICVPTEIAGKPYDAILMDVMSKLVNTYKKNKPLSPPLIIIESTITPNRIDTLVIPFIEKKGLIVGKDILLGVAPRRDWFVSPDKTLETLPRVIGAADQYTTDFMGDVLGIVCHEILKASDHNHACIVKSIENAYRHLDITFANQLSLAFPHLNMVEILKFVGTKWNVGTYHPSFGTGGYCIPLAPQYVLTGAKNPEALTLLKSALDTDFGQPKKVAESLHQRGLRNVGILGLAYTNDIKVETLSPAIAIAKELKKLDVNVKINDPLFTKDELRNVVDCDTFEFPTGMNEFDAILLVSGHLHYVSLPYNKITSNLNNCKFILDNMGFWKDIKFKDIEYHEAGDAYWLEK
jgi:nucleotide sugar dehydrogenase